MFSLFHTADQEVKSVLRASDRLHLDRGHCSSSSRVQPHVRRWVTFVFVIVKVKCV